MVTLAFGRVSGVCLLAGLLLLAAHSNSLALASLGHVRPGALRSTAEVLLLLGFAVKVGLVPFQVWLPRGYAAAAGRARPIMAGVAVNAGFYGLWRTLALLGPPPAGATRVLLVLASLTAVLGIAHAAVQTGLQRVIAYSSVENTGLILAGFGVALVGAAVRSHELLAAGLLAATFQVVTHTVAKSLLFTASARIEEAAGTERPGQAGRRGTAGAMERNRPGHRQPDPGRPAAHRRLRLRVVPAGGAHAAVPGARTGRPAGTGRRGCGSGADGRIRRRDFRAPDRPDRARAARLPQRSAPRLRTHRPRPGSCCSRPPAW